MDDQQILVHLKNDITYFDNDYPQLSNMIKSAGMTIDPYSDLTDDQKAYADLYIVTSPKNNPLIVRWDDLQDSSLYSSMGMSLIEWYTDQDFSGGFPEEIPEDGTIYDLNPKDYNINGLISVLRFDYALGESTSLETLHQFGIHI